ncbi:AraC family transcriptional regulator [Acinetobacter larvae]|uniref:AraC family transcriptional regulator n=2 Tax=Acinetobacter larvae TaxID=1789224 RepID=A0A1B2M446_9GAMM|nr:AraC family transcriptional regulator [Acinetobacter larvae]
MPYVETRRACQSRICYQAHSHGTFSIGAVDAGQSRFSSYLHVETVIEPGCLVTIPAHVQHSCNPLPEQHWSYQMMHLDVVWLAQLLQEHLQQPLQQHIPYFTPQILSNPQHYRVFSQLNAALFDRNLSIAAKEQLLIEALSQILLSDFTWSNSHYFKNEHGLLEQLLFQIDQADHVLSLAELAETAQCSRFALIRLFKHYLGLSPHAYQLNRCVQLARQALQQGQPVIEVAYQLGFSDQSHFHRVFKAHTGVTPKQYQQGYKAAI